MTKQQLDDLKSRIGTHESEVRRLNRELYIARLAYNGLVPGETVVTSNGRERSSFRVRAVGTGTPTTFRLASRVIRNSRTVCGLARNETSGTGR